MIGRYPDCTAEEAHRVIRRARFTWGCAFWLAWSLGASAPMPDRPQHVPTLGCPVNDQMTPTWPLAGESMPAPVQPTLAEQLAYYQAEGSPGVYAPRGWSCRAWYGSSGSTLLVTPKRLEPPYFPLPKITGPTVMIQSSDTESSGRFHVAIVAAQLFPLLGQDLIVRVRLEHLISDASFDVEHHPDDRLEYLSDRLVEYTTPPNRDGLGTDGLLEVSNLPIRGLTILNPDSETNALTEVRVRLPGGLTGVMEAIMQLETVCLQLKQGCRGLQ
jgi:hypothetical protein